MPYSIIGSVGTRSEFTQLIGMLSPCGTCESGQSLWANLGPSCDTGQVAVEEHKGEKSTKNSMIVPNTNHNPAQ